MTDTRILHSSHGVTLTEVKLFSPVRNMAIAYSVASERTKTAKAFSNLADAQNFYLREVQRSEEKR